MTENITEPPQQEPRPDAPPPGWHSQNLKDYRALRRSRADRKVAGVAGGLGRHLNVDPTILRVLFVVLTLFGGSGLLLYAVLWLLVPEEDTGRAVASVSESTRNALLIGAAVVAGLLALGETWTDSWLGWPLAVLGLVVAVVLVAKDRNAAATSQPPPSPYAESTSGSQVGAPWYPPTSPPPVRPRPRRRDGPVLFGITLALVALALGILGLLDASGSDVVDAAYPALALGVVGAMLVVGAFWGRPGGLIALGLFAALLLAAFSIGEPSFDGDRTAHFAPQRAAEVADAYEVPAGRIVLDLSRVEDVAELDGRRIGVEANAGEIVVILPEELGVDLDASVDYGGTIETPDGTRDGWSSQVREQLGDPDAVAMIALEMDLQFGRITVSQP